jgi:hypothetical protein
MCSSLTTLDSIFFVVVRCGFVRASTLGILIVRTLLIGLNFFNKIVVLGTQSMERFAQDG